MGSLSVWHWLIVLAVTMLLFGRSRISALLGDIGKGIGGLRREVRRFGDDQYGSRKVSQQAEHTLLPIHSGSEANGSVENTVPEREAAPVSCER